MKHHLTKVKLKETKTKPSGEDWNTELLCIVVLRVNTPILLPRLSE